MLLDVCAFLLNSFDLLSQPILHRFFCFRLIVCELELFNRVAGFVQWNAMTRNLSVACFW